MYQFKENSMIAFDSVLDFKGFLERLQMPSNWVITMEKNNLRGERVKDRPYVNYLRDLFMEKGLFRRNISIAEIVSLLDSYTIMMRVIKHLENMVGTARLKHLKMYSEYKIYFSKNRRIDYVLEYNNRLLLIEFRVSFTFPNLSSMWQKKETELLFYKELLSNYLPETYKVHLFAFIAMPEVDNGYRLPKHVKYNNDNSLFFAEYIKTFILDQEDGWPQGDIT